MKNSIFIAFLVLFTGSTISAQTEFQKGIEAYNQKDYRQAIDQFEKVIKQEPLNVSALVNLGNSLYENKNYGKAILQYEKALKISPNDLQISQNIESCYTALNIQEPYTSPFGKIETLLYRIGELTWGVLSIVMAFFTAFFLFKAIKNKGKQRLENFVIVGFSALLMILFVYSTRTVHHYKSTKRHAIVTAPNAPVCNNEMGELSGETLTEGVRIEIVDQTKDFYQFHDQIGNLRFICVSDVERF